MWSYYELTTAQAQADRLNASTYSLPIAAKHEFTQEAVERAVSQRRQNERDGKRTAICLVLTNVVVSIRDALHRQSALAR